MVIFEVGSTHTSLVTPTAGAWMGQVIDGKLHVHQADADGRWQEQVVFDLEGYTLIHSANLL